MALAGLADIWPIRALVIASGLILVGAGVLTQLMPGLGQPAAEWRRAAHLLRNAKAAPEAAGGRAATAADFDVLRGLIPELGAMSRQRQSDFLVGALVREAAPGTALVKVGEAADSAFFVVRGRAVAGVPTEGGEDRSLSAMGPGDFFGEIGALTGSPRTANVIVDEAMEVVEVPAATLKALMDEPAMRVLVTSKMSERLTRTSQADLIRLAGIDQRDLRDLRRRRPKAPPPPAVSPEASAAD